MRIRLLIAVLLATWGTLSAAQDTVYESEDKAGPVFSDQPSSGATPIDLPPPNVIEVTPPASQEAAAAPAASYTSLVISSPADGSTIYTNTGAFNVSAQTDPVLQTAGGDRIQVKLDGNLLTPSYESANFRVTEADWQGAANPDDVEHTLQLAIVDGTGAVQIESDPVTFYAHRTTVRRATHY